MSAFFEFECFLAAAETLNFTSAAQKVYITQPAFSRKIAALEKELGFLLFQRGQRQGLRITPAGVVLYNGLKTMRQEFSQLLDQAKLADRSEEGKLVISILNGLDFHKISQLIEEFQQAYPSIEITLKSCNVKELLPSVNNGSADACFSLNCAASVFPDLLTEPIGMIEGCLAVPARLNCDPEKIYSISNFKDQIFLLSTDAPVINDLFVSTCQKAGFEPKTEMAPDYETKMLWVEMGVGVAGYSKDYLMSRSPLVNLVHLKEFQELEYSFVWHRENYNPAISLFYTFFDSL